MKRPSLQRIGNYERFLPSRVSWAIVPSSLFEIAHVFVGLNHVARLIVNADDGIIVTG